MFCLEHTCLSQYPCSHRTCMFITVSLWPQRGLFSHCWCFEDDILGTERKLLAYKRAPYSGELSWWRACLHQPVWLHLNLFIEVLLILRFYFWLCVSVCVCVCSMCKWVLCPQRSGEKRALDPLELELQAIMSHLMQMLGAKLWSSGKAARLLITEPSFQALIMLILLLVLIFRFFERRSLYIALAALELTM